MSVNQSAEVEVKLHRLCQEFCNIHRGTVKTIFQLCNRDEDHCRRMLRTFLDTPTSHPLAPGRQISAPPSSTPSEEDGGINIPMRNATESSPVLSQPLPQPTVSSPSQQPAATINLTLDDIMRLLQITRTTDGYDGHTMPYRRPPPRFPTVGHSHRGMHFAPPVPHPVDHRTPNLALVQRDISKILEAQQMQIAEMKQALSEVKKNLASLKQEEEEKHESLNKIGLRVLQGIQDSTLEEKQILIQTLEVDIQNLFGKKGDLEAAADQLKPRPNPDPPNFTPTVWRCQYCTFDNDMTQDECTVCHFKRGTKPNTF